MQALGLQLETRPFAPHVTLARVKFPRDAVGLTDRLAREPGKVFGTMKVESVALMRSELSSTGAVYSVLHAARLNAL